MIANDYFIAGMLCGTFLFSTGLALGWFMGIAREKTDRERAERELPASARPDTGSTRRF